MKKTNQKGVSKELNLGNEGVIEANSGIIKIYDKTKTEFIDVELKNIIMKSPDGSRWRISILDNGDFDTIKIT